MKYLKCNKKKFMRERGYPKYIMFTIYTRYTVSKKLHRHYRTILFKTPTI